MASQPQSQSQPATWWYPILPALQSPNVTVYASAADAQSKGVTSDSYNPEKNIKPWVADPAWVAANTDGNGNVTFSVAPVPTAAVIAAGVQAYGQAGQITMPATEALAINLPDPGVGGFWPGYVAPPTDAVMYGPGGVIGPANPDIFCLQVEANAIAAEISAALRRAATVNLPGPSLYYYQYPQGGQRRPYVVTITGVTGQWNAQGLIELKNANGVDRPGHWNLSVPTPAPIGLPYGATLSWVYDTPPFTAPPGEVAWPTPIRALLPNEVFVYCYAGLLPGGNPFPGEVMQYVVERTDVVPPPIPAALAPAVSGDPTNAQILAMLQAIEAKLGMAA